MPHIWCSFFLFFNISQPLLCRELCGVLVLVFPNYSVTPSLVRSLASTFALSTFALCLPLFLFPSILCPLSCRIIYAQTNHRVSFSFFRSPFFTIRLLNFCSRFFFLGSWFTAFIQILTRIRNFFRFLFKMLQYIKRPIAVVR